ncbi:MAG: DM13 domain-containing protein [Rubricoccaceae bacterium]
MRLLFVIAAFLTLAACQNTPTEAADDPLPTASSTPTEESDTAAPTAEQIEAEANMPTVLVSDTMPVTPQRIASGTFSGAGFHDVSGTAALYRLDDGSHLVRLDELVSDNGPDLEVWLVRRTTGDVGEGGVSLGPLKSTQGNQNYAVPADLDLAEFAGVSVWCRRFGVNFGTAPLQPE